MYDNDIFELKKRANRGNIRACFELGLIYLCGDCVPVDIVESKKWFDKATEMNASN